MILRPENGALKSYIGMYCYRDYEFDAIRPSSRQATDTISGRCYWLCLHELFIKFFYNAVDTHKHGI